MEEVKRVISVFNRKSEFLISEIDISHLPIHLLVSIFNPPANDPLMYENYWIDEESVCHFQDLIDFDLKENIYQVECSKPPK